jgi:SlyX protein
MSIESRVMDVELRFMKLERFTQELSDVVAEQGRAIDALRSETQRLRALVSEGSDHGARDARDTAQADDKPPHY